jgi:ATP-dependent DNA helicase RecG
MKENGIYDKKSLRSVVGKTADFGELAKDCVAFCNAEGGHIDIGIEDGETMPPAEQKIPDGLTTAIINRISEKTVGVVLSAETLIAGNGSEYIRLYIPRNPNAAAATTSGKFYLRIGDQSKPVGPHRQTYSQRRNNKGHAACRPKLQCQAKTTYLSWTYCHA